MYGRPCSSPMFVDRADIGVVQSRGGPGFALEALKSLTVFGKFIGEKLQRNMAAEARIFSLENDTHSAAADVFKDVTVRDGPASHARPPF